MPSNPELKPCPFCGAAALVSVYRSPRGFSGTSVSVTIMCGGKECPAVPTVHGSDYHGDEEAAKAEAVAAWNRRATHG